MTDTNAVVQQRIVLVFVVENIDVRGAQLRIQYCRGAVMGHHSLLEWCKGMAVGIDKAGPNDMVRSVNGSSPLDGSFRDQCNDPVFDAYVALALKIAFRVHHPAIHDNGIEFLRGRLLIERAVGER